MIKFSLQCKDCKNIYDSWFSTSKDYDKIKKLKLLNCNKCSSSNVEKSIMSPNLNSTKKKLSLPNKREKNIKNKIKSYQNFIKQNFKYVGNNFSYEARSMHYNKKNPRNGIYGTATNEEIRDLKEEGIDTQLIPWVEDKSN